MTTDTRTDLIRVVQAGKDLAGMSPGATYEAVRTGRFPLPIVKIGKRSYVRRCDYDAFVNGDSQASPTHAAESA